MKDPEKNPVLTMAISCVVQFITFGLGWTVLPPLMPLIAAELSISHTMHGLIWGAFTLGVGIASPFGGGQRWIDTVRGWLGLCPSSAVRL